MPQTIFYPDTEGYVRKSCFAECDPYPYAEIYDGGNSMLYVSCQGQPFPGSSINVRSYINFTPNSALSGKTITRVQLGLYIYDKHGGTDKQIWGLPYPIDPGGSYEDNYNEISGISGTLYYSAYDLGNTSTYYTYDLGASAVTELSSHNTWLTIGLTQSEAFDGELWDVIFGTMGFGVPYVATLIVDYTEGGATYRRRVHSG